jgi:hypothetical protein
MDKSLLLLSWCFRLYFYSYFDNPPPSGLWSIEWLSLPYLTFTLFQTPISTLPKNGKASTRPRRVRQTLNPSRAAQDSADNPPTGIGDIEDLAEEPPPAWRSKCLRIFTSGSSSNGDGSGHSWTEFDIVIDEVNPINDSCPDQDENGNSR